MFLKLDGQTIIGHDYSQHDDYQTEVGESVLIENHPTFGVVYKYKYVDGQLVELTEEEKAVHPVMINNWKQQFDVDRKAKIDAIKWMREEYPQSEASEACRAAVLAYIMELKNLPDTEGFKYYAPIWPEVPQYQKA